MRLRAGLPVCLLLLQHSVNSETKPRDWVLSFSDEFDGSALDLAKWSPRGNPAALTVSGGMLHITAPGVATTYGLFAQAFGRFEIRCHIPAGLRTSFALLPIPTGTLPGIDVFRANAPPAVVFGNHWGTEQTERSFSDTFSLGEGFHTISMEWDRETIRWFVDGKQKFGSADGVPRQAMYLQLDVAAQRGAKTAATFDVDYIRVYKIAP
jgi:beta-glucanase (GH16 family)